MAALCSMTGYGRGESTDSRRHYVVEMRSVNNRYLDVSCRLPREYQGLEELIKAAVKEYLSRGRVDITVSVAFFSPARRNLVVNEELATQVWAALDRLCNSLGIEHGPDLHSILSVPDIIRLDEATEDLDEVWAGLTPAVESALAGLSAMRAEEGQRIKADLIHRITATEQLISGIGERSPRVVDEYRQKLYDRVNELCRDVDLDPRRLEMEVVLVAERASITEELVRLASHLQAFNDTLVSGGVVGRKLDFILQEANREINTIGSKSSDLEISRLVVEVKSELEKIREQVQNIE